MVLTLPAGVAILPGDSSGVWGEAMLAAGRGTGAERGGVR